MSLFSNFKSILPSSSEMVENQDGIPQDSTIINKDSFKKTIDSPFSTAAPVIHSFKDLPAAARKMVLQQLLETCSHEELFLAHSLADQLLTVKTGSPERKKNTSTVPSNTFVAKDLLRVFHPKLFPHTRKSRYPSGVVQIDFLAWLPLELATKIILNLDIGSIVRLSNTSKYYNQIISKHDFIWRKLCHRDYDGILDQLALEARVHNYKNQVRRLDNMSWREKYVYLYLIGKNWSRGNYKVQDVDKKLAQSQAFNPFNNNNPTPHHHHHHHHQHQNQNQRQTSFYLSFDDTKAISVSPNTSGRVWSLIDGQVITMLDGHDGMISTAKMSKRYIVTGSIDSNVKLWCPNTGTCIKTLQGHVGEITCIFIHCNNRYILTGSEDCSAILWDLEAKRSSPINSDYLKWRFVGHQSSVVSVQCDDKIAVTGSCDSTIKVWDIATGTCLNTLSSHTDHVYALQFRSDLLISGSGDSSLKMWSIKNGTCMKTLKGHQAGILCLQFDERKIVSGSIDFTIKIWDVKTGNCLNTLHGHRGAIWSLRFDHSKLFSSSLDQTLLVWDFDAVHHRQESYNNNNVDDDDDK